VTLSCNGRRPGRNGACHPAPASDTVGGWTLARNKRASTAREREKVSLLIKADLPQSKQAHRLVTRQPLPAMDQVGRSRAVRRIRERGAWRSLLLHHVIAWCPNDRINAIVAPRTQRISRSRAASQALPLRLRRCFRVLPLLGALRSSIKNPHCRGAAQVGCRS